MGLLVEVVGGVEMRLRSKRIVEVMKGFCEMFLLQERR